MKFVLAQYFLKTNWHSYLKKHILKKLINCTLSQKVISSKLKKKEKEKEKKLAIFIKSDRGNGAGARFVSTSYLDTEVACFDDNNVRVQFQEFINAASVSGKIILFPSS